MSNLGDLWGSMNVRNGVRCGLTSVYLTWASNGILLPSRRGEPFQENVYISGRSQEEISSGVVSFRLWAMRP